MTNAWLFSRWLVTLVCAFVWFAGSMVAQEELSDGITIEQVAAQLDDVLSSIESNHVDSPTLDTLLAALPRSTQDQSVRERLAELLKSYDELDIPDAAIKSIAPSIHEAILRKTPGIGSILSAHETMVTKQLLANQYVGIGIQLRHDVATDRLIFDMVFPEGSAAQSGIRTGDALLLVDGRPTSHESLSNVVQWIRGPAGTQVELQIQSVDHSARTFIVPRRVVPLPTISLVQHKADSSIAMVEFSRMSASCVTELRKIENSLDSKIKTILLDWRKVQEDDLHTVHLLMDGLLDEASVGFVKTKHGVREITTESGRLFRGRQVVTVTCQNTSGCMQWAARCLTDFDVPCLLDYLDSRSRLEWSDESELPSNVIAVPAYAMEWVPIPNGRGSIRLATGRLLDKNQLPVNIGMWNAEPVSTNQSSSNQSPAFATPQKVVECVQSREFSGR
jgi:hypothetical protein